MTTPDERFHETWMGMVQPIEGLVVSMPVLLRADIAARKPAEVHERFKTHLAPPSKKKASTPTIADVRALAADLLEIGDELRDDAPPQDLSVHLAEGKETIRPTWAIRGRPVGSGADAPPYQLLAWELPPDVDLDRPDTRAGTWAYPPRAKFDRLLRHTRVPIGLLTNGRVLRLVYAPAGESTGAITFRVADMAKVEGRPILDALLMLVHARRFEGSAEGRSLPELLAESRRVQAEVSKELEKQVRAALERLLRGFEEAAEREGDELVREAHADGTLTHGLLTLLLRIVFVLFAEDRELLPMDHAVYREGLSVLGLFERLQRDNASFPDSMSRRFGAYGRLVALFRAIFLGVKHRDLVMPPRYGDLFSPHRFPFLEGWGPAGGAPITLAEDRARVRVPSVDDGCIFDVLSSLLYLKRERLSYRALDVEQIGSVYEGLIAYGVTRLASPAIRVGPHGVWVEAEELLAEKPGARAKWLKDRTDLAAGKCDAIAAAVAKAKSEADAGAALRALVKEADDFASAGRLVLQPGPDRKHTSSHYTPRSLSEPIVEKTLRPLLAAMGDAPDPTRILSLKVCDPAMGSGAFLVAACRFLGAELVAAWTRSGVIEKIAKDHADVVTHARRLVAQRCLYGVDKNPFAVSLGKLSLWLATLAKDEPFTFIDHALRCGDSLVGLSFEQIEKFTWEPVAPKGEEEKEKKGQLQLDFVKDEIGHALKEALAARQRIEALAEDGSLASLKEKERLLDDATDALARVRLIGDLVVGAFFAQEKAKDREVERESRERKVRTWLNAGGPVPDDLRVLAEKTREELRPFHWPVEFPEIFFAERPDPLQAGKPNRVAYMDAFVGNPPFSGKNGIIDIGPLYLPWLQGVHVGVHGNADLSAHFLRRADGLLGSHGTIGFVCTKTVAQGDTREAALQPLIRQGRSVYDAVRLLPWPGDAAVTVSTVHLAKGNARNGVVAVQLDGVEVATINSRLRAGEERPDPLPLAVNSGMSFQGSIVLGQGFLVTAAQRDALVAKNRRNADCLFPFLGGDEINGSPTHATERWVIYFGQRSLEEAQAWPDLLDIVVELVKPEREKLKDNATAAPRKRRWWQFAAPTPGLYSRLQGTKRCVVTSGISKHRVFARVSSAHVFSHNLYVFPFEGDAPFAVLQSRIHVAWANLLSSGLEDRGGYRPSDCFDTFPFPFGEPDAHAPELETIGAEFSATRSNYMRNANVGLTRLYDDLKRPECVDREVVNLRRLHLQIDSLVLRAFGWGDLEPPPFTAPVTDEEKRAASLFEDTVIDRLFALNAERAKMQPKTTAHRRRSEDDSPEDASTTKAMPRVRKRSKKAPA